MDYEKLHNLKNKITKKLLLGLQKVLPENMSIRINISKEANKTLSCYLYNLDIGAIKNPWNDSNAKKEFEFEEANIEKIKSKKIKFEEKQNLSETENFIKKELEKNYYLIIEIMNEYDDVLISPTKINCENVSIFQESSKRIIKRKNK